ncbi:MAG: small subunit ribosomal protein S3 [Candidatus Berkelbacteria bacterium Licking1014_2]|uniref:Small ribosomal subunit protein uS3 n=1 Tax=Candidatus Berkelbacteria bacterium Licking1014_2 TaxID=2017146 RepID=A0A554LWX1_9BACT|nr:MAG: small subunit ribosomal protein S3 [Candidatus Berkelbacteria bacterium Licking1014_2]
MGHKANPLAVRLINKKNWESKWFANRRNFGRILVEDVLIRRLVEKIVGHVGAIAKIIIERQGEMTTVNIHTGRPGVLIGRSGQATIELKKKIETEFNLKPVNIKINIIEVKNPNLSAILLAKEVAGQLSRRLHYRRVGKKTIDKAVAAGAKGIRLILAGRLGGAEIARTEKFQQGSIPASTFRQDIDFARVDAKTTYGTIGIKVYLYQGEKGEKNVNA